MLFALRAIVLALWSAAGVHSADVSERLTLEELRGLSADAGFTEPDVAAAVAMAESEGVVGAEGDSGHSLGLWQIHVPSHPEFDASKLKVAQYNALAAVEISKGGRDWRMWSAYRDGRYRKFLRR